jgi:putative serine protease PepD
VQQAAVSILIDGAHKGSGFFVDPTGLVATASHVVKGKAEGIEIVSPAAGRLQAEKVAVDLGHDLALLRVPRREVPYPALRLADRVPPPGSRVFLFGDPLFRRRLLLTGAVASEEPTYCYAPGVDGYVRAFYVTGPAPTGTSGGCWVDAAGRVVGVQAGYLNTAAKAPVGIAFVSPADALRGLLATRQSPDTPTLGALLEDLWTQPAGYIARFPKGTTGVATVKPQPDGPLARAGLTKESLITAVDGAPVTCLDGLLAAVRSKRPGDEITLEILDPDHKPKRTVQVRLGTLRE